MLVCQNAEGVYGQSKVGNPWFSCYSLCLKIKLWKKTRLISKSFVTLQWSIF